MTWWWLVVLAVALVIFGVVQIEDNSGGTSISKRRSSSRERRAGVPRDAGPTAVMRDEHRVIKALLGEISLRIGDPSADSDTPRRELREVLSAHNMKKEERVLYPGTDRLLTEDERDALVRRIQAYRR